MKTTMKKRIYSITRSDLCQGQKAVQSLHAGIKYAIEHQPHHYDDWHKDGSIICLELGNEKSLKRWMKKLENMNIPYSIFKEPDRNHEITAIATLHTGEIFKGIPLLK